MICQPALKFTFIGLVAPGAQGKVSVFQHAVAPEKGVEGQIHYRLGHADDSSHTLMQT